MHVINDTLALRLETNGPEARLVSLQGDLDNDSRHGVESTLATLHLRGRLALVSVFRLDRVTFRHAAPARTTDLARVFGAPLAFGEAEDALHFPTALLEATRFRRPRSKHQALPVADAH